MIDQDGSLKMSISEGGKRLKVREVRLLWLGHVQRRDSEYIRQSMLEKELPGRRTRERPQRDSWI